jgi:hypothetical protein
MTFPAIIFGFVLATIFGAVFHFWRGGSLKKLFLFIILAWLGFWVGHGIGTLLGLTFASTGPVNTGMAAIGSLVFLFIGEWLSRVEITKNRVQNKKNPPR